MTTTAVEIEQDEQEVQCLTCKIEELAAMRDTSFTANVAEEGSNGRVVTIQLPLYRQVTDDIAARIAMRSTRRMICIVREVYGDEFDHVRVVGTMRKGRNNASEDDQVLFDATFRRSRVQPVNTNLVEKPKHLWDLRDKGLPGHVHPDFLV